MECTPTVTFHQNGCMEKTKKRKNDKTKKHNMEVLALESFLFVHPRSEPSPVILELWLQLLSWLSPRCNGICAHCRNGICRCISIGKQSARRCNEGGRTSAYSPLRKIAWERCERLLVTAVDRISTALSPTMVSYGLSIVCGIHSMP